MAIDLDGQRAMVLRALSGAMRHNAMARRKLLGVTGAALAAATDADRSVRTAPTMAAVDRYTGVLYQALDHATLTGDTRRRLHEDVVILSGLWGLVSPTDPLPDYKLKMGASLGRLGRLSGWWRDPLSERLLERAHGQNVWNLLPREHDAAVRAPGLRQWSVTFLEPGPGGALVAVAHWNKLLKGALVRHLLEHPATTPSDLEEWEHPLGFVLDPARESVDGPRVRLAFVRS